jgi:DNA polymerase III epsilon subunit-like protein
MIRRILDLETTGLNMGLKLDVPVSVGMTDVQGNELLYQVVRPAVPSDPEALATHGISETRLKYDDVVWFSELVESRLGELLSDAHLLIYNAAYDVRILLNAAWHSEVLLPRFTYECVMLRYAEAFGYPSKKEAGQYKWWSLSTAFEQQCPFDPLVRNAHNALGDCQMTAKLIAKLESGITTPVHFDGEFPVRLVKMDVQTSYKGDPYIRLYTIGGQTVNVFGKQYKRLIDAGLDPFELIDRRGPAEKYIERIAYISYGQPGDWYDFPELVRIEPDWSGASER